MFMSQNLTSTNVELRALEVPSRATAQSRRPPRAAALLAALLAGCFDITRIESKLYRRRK